MTELTQNISKFVHRQISSESFCAIAVCVGISLEVKILSKFPWENSCETVYKIGYKSSVKSAITKATFQKIAMYSLQFVLTIQLHPKAVAIKGNTRVSSDMSILSRDEKAVSIKLSLLLNPETVFHQSGCFRTTNIEQKFNKTTNRG